MLACFCGMTVGAAIAGVIGYTYGEAVGERSVRREAIQARVAEWKPADDGSPEFSFLPPASRKERP